MRICEISGSCVLLFFDGAGSFVGGGCVGSESRQGFIVFKFYKYIPANKYFLSIFFRLSFQRLSKKFSKEIPA
jgi:hypothetical protein